nr:O-antigen ligase family protein [Atlantibacter hermannii]
MLKSRNVFTGSLVVFILALCFVWPIPNGSLPFHRNGLIYPVIVFALGLFFTSPTARQHLNTQQVKPIVLFLWALTFFILLNGLIVAPDIKEMVSTWDGQWVRPVLLFCAGIVLVAAIQAQFASFDANKLFTLIILFFWGVICIHLLDTVWLYWRDGIIHWGETRIVFNRTRMSFQINMITGFLIAELLARALIHKRFLLLKTSFLIVMLVANLICTALVDTRWGTIGLVGSLFSTFLLLSLHKMRRGNIMKIGAIFIALALAAAAVAYTSWKTDPRWQALESDAVAGWNAPFTSFCYNKTDGSIPRNEDGLPINHSNGCRASFFHQGWKLVGEHPFGIGPRKEAFREILRNDLNDPRINIPHSHYGLIEFGLQNGIAGIAGWLVLLLMCWYTGWKQYRHGNMMAGLFLLLFTIGFFSRTLVDHNLKDHYLEQYMLLTGLLVGICATRNREISPPPQR